MEENLVSVIMPAYNSANYIEEAIESVVNQSYKNWELIIVDDNSNDNTEEIVNKIIEKDNRIKYFKFRKNMGAAHARNKAMEMAEGRFLAFLDADDIWEKEKLNIQINYMLDNKCAISHSDYEVIANDGSSINKFVTVPARMTYDMYLKNTIIQTVTVVLDKEYVGDVKMPIIKMRQDFATWLSILKQGYEAHGINQVLGKYRRTVNSLSSNKFKAAKKTWYVYREVEKLNIFKASYCFTGYAYNAVLKRIYIKKWLGKVS